LIMDCIDLELEQEKENLFVYTKKRPSAIPRLLISTRLGLSLLSY